MFLYEHMAPPSTEPSFFWGMCGAVEKCQSILYRSQGQGPIDVSATMQKTRI